MHSNNFLKEFDSLKPEEGAVFKFERPGQAICARFIARRNGVQTKSVTALAKCLDADILEATDTDMVGPATIFESSHITQLMERANLSAGQGFVLKFCNVDRRTRFKRFAYKRLPELDATDGGPLEPSGSGGKRREED
jgi:hypothetical protein